MRVALYIEGRREQIILTPEDDTETRILQKLKSAKRNMSIHEGSFYACQGGWTRQGSDKNSTIIVLDEKQDEVMEGPSDA